MGKLTVKQLEALTSDELGNRLFDGEGLYGRVRKQKSGIVVTFEYRYKQQGKQRTTTCGKWPSDTLKSIRKTRDNKREMVDTGHDPIEQNRAIRLQNKVQQAQAIEQQKAELQRLAAEEANRRTLSQAISKWHKLELSRRKDGGEGAMRALNKDVLPVLGDVNLVDIKRAMIIDILDQVVARGARVMANHLFGDLKQFYNFAVAREWVEAHPLAGITKDKIGGRQKERDRYLSEAEIRELNERLPTAGLQQTIECAIWIMLSTCCRVGELTRARWDDINLDSGEWKIPASNSKNAKEHTIFLSDFTKKQFRDLNEITGTTDWCYPTRDDSGHIDHKTISKQIRDRVRTEPLANRSKDNGTLLLSGGAWTPHDLRRSGATLMGELGIMGEVIERCLNHVEQNKLKRIYQRHEFKAEKREAWRLLGERLDLLLSTGEKDNIVVGHFSNLANNIAAQV